MIIVLFLGAWLFHFIENRMDRNNNYNDDGAGFFLAEYFDGDVNRFFDK